MSVTPAFLDELRSRVLISDLVGRFVSWDQRKSQPAKGDYWAPCPFHSEKTASFHADDRKGYYYCFGCHEKGDAINFLKTKANMDFMDAVRELAAMAGMPMPEYSPQAREQADTNTRLIDMHEKAAKFFSQQLASSAGTQAREYLLNIRGLNAKDISDFDIGFIPNARDLLTSFLRTQGYFDNELLEGGLSLKPDDAHSNSGGAIFDRFRHRIIFPIKDPRGRVVGFGGRAMDPSAKAKYLNSAESPIYHKGRLLYNLQSARNHVKDQAHLIVAEGYMDVIAIAKSGLKTAVAPLGTAITDEQLELIWKIDPMPVIALDGDVAGQRAALRLCDLALPKLGPGKSLNFAILPAGQDPDDLIKADGGSAFRALISSPTSMVEMLWRRTLGDGVLVTPEERSRFDKRLRDILKAIPDPNLREHYKADFTARRRELWKPAQPAQNFTNQPNKTTGKTTGKPSGKSLNTPPVSKSTALLAKKGYEHDLMSAVAIKAILTHPKLGAQFMDEVSKLICSDPKLEELRRDIVLTYGDHEQLERLALSPKIDALKAFKGLSSFSITKPKTPDGEVITQLHDEFDRIGHLRALEHDLEAVIREIKSAGETNALNERLFEIVKLRDMHMRKTRPLEDVSTDNASFLRQFLESESWRK